MLTNDVTNQQGVKMPRLQWNVVKRWLTFIRNAIMRRCEIHEHEAINRLRFFYQSCSHPSDTIIVTLEVMICFFGCEFVTNVLHHHHYFSFSLHGCCCKHSPLWFHGKFHKKGGISSPPPQTVAARLVADHHHHHKSGTKLFFVSLATAVPTTMVTFVCESCNETLKKVRRTIPFFPP